MRLTLKDAERLGVPETLAPLLGDTSGLDMSVLVPDGEAANVAVREGEDVRVKVVLLLPDREGVVVGDSVALAVMEVEEPLVPETDALLVMDDDEV